MNIILIRPHEINGDWVVLEDHRAEHIVKVLRSDKGDRVNVGILDGKTGFATIEKIDRKRPFQVKLFLNIDQDPPAPPLTDVILALPRPIVFRRIIHQLTSLGVGQVFVINASRVEKSYWEASIVSDNGWREYVITGLEQAVDTRMVPITFHRGFKPFMLETVPELSNRYDSMLVAHPGACTSISKIGIHKTRPVLVAIGPEGGWNDFELALMRSQGFVEFTIGARILKVETAAAAIHAQISLMREMG